MYKKSYLLWIFFISALSFVSCRSTEFHERVTRLETKINELNGSKQYLAQMTASELFDLREESTLILLEEGEYQLNLVGIDGHPDAKEKAIFSFEAVKKLANEPLSVQDEELKQKWNAIRWAWIDLTDDNNLVTNANCPQKHPGHCYEWKVWQGCKLLIPGLQGYSGPETVIAFIGDLIFSWNTEIEGKIDVPPLSSLHVARAESGLKRLESAEIRKESAVNVEIIFSYLLTASVEELSAFSGLVERYYRLPGRDGKYQQLWDGMIRDWLVEQGGYITKKTFHALPHEDENKLLVRAIATGYVPTEKLITFLKKYGTEIRLEDDSESVRFSSSYVDPVRGAEGEE